MDRQNVVLAMEQENREDSMALSDEQIAQGQKYLKAWQRCTSLPMASHHLVFAQAIETDVSKADTELIRQMLEAIESVNQAMPFPVASAAITAARARLDGGIFAPENAHLFTQEAAVKAFAHVKPPGES